MKNAIIVGATSGIGLEVARIMRSEGVNIGVAAAERTGCTSLPKKAATLCGNAST